MSARLRQLREEAWRWALVVLFVLVVVLNLQASALRGSIDRVERSSARTEVAANELVDFVHEIEKQQQPTGQTQQAVELIVNVLCASSDPVRIQACAALTQPPGG